MNLRDLTPSIEASADPRGLGALLSEGEARPFPLESVRVRMTLSGPLARTEVVQRFSNPYTAPLDVVYLFPLPEDGAVVEVILRCGAVEVRAACRRRQAAEATFEAARAAGHRAALITQERDDVHTLRVSNLPPGEEVAVRLVILEQLDAVDGLVRWRFPTTIAPRYLSGQPTGHSGLGALPDTDLVPDASRLQPPLRLSGGTSLDLEVEVVGPVRRVTSSLHAVALELGDTVKIAPSTLATLDRDFVLGVALGEPERAAVRAWTDGTYTAVTVLPPAVRLPVALLRDVVFVVDISGSMSGQKLVAAKRALSTALRGLMPGDRFELIAFDDRVERFEGGFAEYADSTLSAALGWVSALQARGGTEMYPPLEAALAGETPEGRLRTVLFITDGQSWEEERLVQVLARRAAVGRVYTLGIDSAVNGALLKRLARVGGGVCELATPDDDLEAIVARFEARFGHPVLTGLTVAGAEVARREREALFAGSSATMLLKGVSGAVTVRGQGSDGPFEAAVTPVASPFPLGPLWARARIDALQERLLVDPGLERELRPMIEALAVEHGIASRYTAFVAVETGRVVDGEAVEVVQPSELPASWEGAASGGGGPRAQRPAAAMFSSGAVPPPSPVMPAPAPRVEPAASPPRGLLKRAKRALDTALGKAESSAPVRSRPDYGDDGGGMVVDQLLARPHEPAEVVATAELLGRTQGADGSFGGSVERTAAALLLLLLQGHTRVSGLRRRTVLKAARWLGARPEPIAAAVIALLEAVEAGETLELGGRWPDLAQGTPEGRGLAAVR
ncbi:MAG: VWA domain-containing protein [Deltaproteobacteria bacterium]|nr:VWA domain-containing protein [Deltaproteobacteria bacterium]